ncbi:MAG TPA: SRPBCC family protein [Bauldia sp.]|nr:SRPBCC family protein [Bauldia sp.]
MEIKQSFTVARPLPEVWALFQDVPAVASCMPGAELLADKGNGLYQGRISIRLGPFSAAFEGEAQVTPDAATHSGHVEGKGTDKRGGSRSKLVLDYRLAEVAGGTKVDVDADVQLVGPIAQFGRTGIVNETANVLIRQFVQNVEQKLAAMPAAPSAASASSAAAAAASASTPAAGSSPAPTAAPTNQISALRLFAAVIGSWFRRLFGRG